MRSILLPLQYYWRISQFSKYILLRASLLLSLSTKKYLKYKCNRHKNAQNIFFFKFHPPFITELRYHNLSHSQPTKIKKIIAFSGSTITFPIDLIANFVVHTITTIFWFLRLLLCFILHFPFCTHFMCFALVMMIYNFQTKI